ncbi:RICIN domain-containing protein [Streptomyces sp. NBS 14/10]|uniref:RICIN domain-containing protein n=1 Tax=Streptomyces sp. NBS 14/10 TaxID=1945643 RepID=UPI00211B1521|nr:RICIN domain-containing protein [Streptomyces sp. NBS 14/10]KAK1176777.1 RICIN domain-containing protein [Streptomyces sp. NBS 14/10]
MNRSLVTTGQRVDRQSGRAAGGHLARRRRRPGAAGHRRLRLDGDEAGAAVREDGSRGGSPHDQGRVCRNGALDAFASISFPATNANYKILNKRSTKAIDVSGASTSAGANIIQWNDTGAQNQHWRWVAVGDGSYEIANQNSGLLPDVTSGSTADGATIIQQTDNNVGAGTGH